MYVSNAPTFGTQASTLQNSYAQPQVIAQPIAPTGYTSPFAMHGGYYQPPLSGGQTRQFAPAPPIDPNY